MNTTDHGTLRILGKNTLRYSLYAAVIVIILTLSGIFSIFAGREVIAGRITLDTVTLIAMAVSTGIVVALPLREWNTLAKIFNAAVGGLVVGLSVAFVILLETLIPQQDLIFVFSNYRPLIGSRVAFGVGAEQIGTGILALISFSTLMGALGGLLMRLPARGQQMILSGLAGMVIIGLMENQIRNIITPADALAIILSLIGGYAIAQRFKVSSIGLRLLSGFLPGLGVGILAAFLVSSGPLQSDSFWRFGGDEPVVLGLADTPLLFLPVLFGIVGSVGALLTMAPILAHNGLWFVVVITALLAVLNTQQRMNDFMAVTTFVTLAVAVWFIPQLGKQSGARYSSVSGQERGMINGLSSLTGLALMLVAPIFLGQYITNVLDLVMLYIIMGIGLNVMVGYAGLLDLGYVASFAIGAYTSAILTTPSVITTGCIVEGIEQFRYAEMCVGIAENWQGFGLLTFWQAWPIAVIVSALTGMALGIPVLRLRGDYLAIVTLGFGEMTRVLTRAQITEPLLGAAQGITPVPFPVIDLTGVNENWFFEMSNASSIYYLYVFSVLLAAFVVWRLAGSRLGRAWRAMKADEDVAQAMGVPLVRTKLMAFGISSAFAGLGGAIFAAQLRGIFPDSFTLLVSINVLSLIIIGGLGSIPGVILGAFILVGLPEVLRELQDYRLLVFGVLLVIAMLLKPDGLVPPPVRRLSERIRSPEKSTPTGVQVTKGAS